MKCFVRNPENQFKVVLASVSTTGDMFQEAMLVLFHEQTKTDNLDLLIIDSSEVFLKVIQELQIGF